MSDDFPIARDAWFGRIGDIVLEELRDFPAGRNEIELMRRLEREGVEGFTQRPSPGDSLALFQTHFLLFHALYRLRERLVATGESGLEIHCMRTMLTPLGDGEESAIAHHDPLRDYYLDLTHLEQTTHQQVEEMLSGFWEKQRAREHEEEALTVLGLEAPVELRQIKHQYRRLAARHHPDRGGDKERLQAINAAMATLEKLYR